MFRNWLESSSCCRESGARVRILSPDEGISRVRHGTSLREQGFVSQFHFHSIYEWLLLSWKIYATVTNQSQTEKNWHFEFHTEPLLTLLRSVNCCGQWSLYGFCTLARPCSFERSTKRTLFVQESESALLAPSQSLPSATAFAFDCSLCVQFVLHTLCGSVLMDPASSGWWLAVLISVLVLICWCIEFSYWVFL